MFCLLDNGTMVLGPKEWNARLFMQELEDEYEITFDLPARNVDNQEFVINESLRIAKIAGVRQAAVDSRMQELHGPFVEIEGTDVFLRYDAADKAIEVVKEQLKSEIAANRYALEIGGVVATVAGAEVGLPTDRETRAIFAQALTLGQFDKQWKFGDVWLVLGQAELEAAVAAISGQVQLAFDWEKSKLDELAAADAVQLAAFEVRHPSQIPAEAPALGA